MRLSHGFGLSNSAINWFSSYRTIITQSVQVETYTSHVVLLLFGVTQGSALGGPLFIIYVTPLSEATATDDVEIRKFSDDEQARMRFFLLQDCSAQRQCCHQLGCWIGRTDTWLINRVQLNITKSTIIYTYNPGQSTKPRPIEATPLQVGSSLVQPSQKALNLGVVIDSHLSMEAHVMKTCRAANFHLSRINKIRRFLDFFVLNLL